MGKNIVQQLGALGQAPRNEAAADAGVACARSFSPDPVPIAVASAEQAQAARVATEPPSQPRQFAVTSALHVEQVDRSR